MPPGCTIAIYNTSYGFVSPSIECYAYAISIADVHVERAIAEAVQDEALATGVYIAKYSTEHGTTEYIFTVETETYHKHRMKSAP